MGRSALLPSALALLALCLATTADAQTVFYSTNGSLPATGVVLYGLAPPANMGDADINVTVITNVTDPAVDIYCNPAYGMYLLNNQTMPTNYPQPGFAVWQSNATGQVANLYVSTNDPGYKQLGSYPSFICAVINSDTALNASFTLSATATPAATVLANLQQQALGSIFNACCQKAGSCAPWRALSSNGSLANTNFCTVTDQDCTPQGYLRNLDMSGFNLTCDWSAISTNIATMTSLLELDMSSNPFLTGVLDDVFQVALKMPNLTTLQLSGSSALKGPLIPTTVSPIMSAACILSTGSLRNLLLANMSIGGAFPDCFATSTTFQAINIVGGGLTGTIPDRFTTATSLESFLAYGNNFTGTLPASFGSAKALQTLDLSQNLLAGPIPASWANATLLQYLLLRNNNLNGTVPALLAQLPNIRNLDLKSNAFTALAPAYATGAGLPTNSTLVNFRVSFNSISGPFPTGLAQFPALLYLIIDANNFTGPLPANTTMFPGLRALNVSQNAMTGTIPAAWSNVGIFTLPALRLGNNSLLLHTFDLSTNRFSGPVPGFLNRTNLNAWVYMGVYLTGNYFTNACSPQLTYVPNLCNGTLSSPPPATGTSPISTQGVVSPPQGGTYTVAPPTGTTATEGSPSWDSTSRGHTGLSSGAIAGICIGVVAALAAAAIVAALAIARRGRNIQPTTDAMTSELGRRGSLAQRLKTAGSSALPSRFSREKAAGAAPGKFERFADSTDPPTPQA